jgi:RNA polymerase sigma factor (sigma-70 family)
MTDWNEMDLLREYADHQTESAFAELVQRHINLVYSVALRYVGNPHDAQDVTQAVFVILAQKAASLRPRTTITGWLYETTRLAASQLLRTRNRRLAREQEAYMQSTLDDSNTESVWQQLMPFLEEAMTRLSEKERTVLALRFFANKNGAETAALLGIEEWAARKRAERAVEKLRLFFIKRGLQVPAASITTAISSHSVHAAPVALAKSVTALAITKGAVAGGSTLTLIKGALKVMAYTKAKTAVVIGLAVILAAGTATLAVKYQSRPKGPVPQKSWAYVKRTTPEAALQSLLWAMTKGDLKMFLESLTPEFQNQYMETAGKGKSENELSAMNIRIAAKIADFHNASNEVVSSDEVLLHFRSSGLGIATVPMKKIQGEWKISGNIRARPEGENAY